MIKMAAIQMVSGIDVTANLTVAKRLMSQAAEQGAQLVVLPENFACLSAEESAKLAIKESYGQGPIQDFLAEQAASLSIDIVAGTIPIAIPNEEKVYSACLVFNSSGECIAHYHKIHLFDVQVGDERYFESASVTPGDEVVVVDLPYARLGLSVCYDIRFPELYRQMLTRELDIIAIPAAFTDKTGKAHWEVLSRARAIENLSYVIASGQGGEHPGGRRTYGHSMIINPWGEILDCCQEGEGVVMADFDRDKLQTIRARFPATEHRRIYG